MVSTRNMRSAALLAALFSAVGTVAVVVGSGAAFMNSPAPLCARIAANAVGIVEARDGSTVTLRLPAASSGSPYSCDGDAQ